MKLGFPIVWTIVTKFDSGRARTSDLPRVEYDNHSTTETCMKAL